MKSPKKSRQTFQAPKGMPDILYYFKMCHRFKYILIFPFSIFIFASFIVNAQASENLFSVDANTISLWRFNDLSGSSVTDETGVNNGTALGTAIVDGKFGKARYFNGISDYIRVPDNPSLNNLSQITIEAWVYPQGFDLSCWALDEGLVIKGDASDFYAFNAYGLGMVRNYDPNSWCVSASSFKTIRFGMSFGSVGVSSLEHVPNQWYYVVGTFDGSKVRIYINGVEESSGIAPAQIVANSRDLYINHHTWSGGGASSQRMQGLIDETRISNIARSAEEIAYYYNLATLPNFPPILSNLGQFKSDAITSIQEGQITTENTIVFKATVTDPDNNQVKLQIELKEFNQVFNEQNLLESDFVLSGSEAVITRYGLIDGQYHWRARAVDDKGNVSDWQEFGQAGNVDFEIKLVPLYTQVKSPYPSDELTNGWDDLRYGTGNYADCLDSELQFSTIRSCGCAITSMVMLGRYYAIDIGIDNTSVDPGTINAWLSNNSGYIKNGSLRWGKAIEYLGFVENGVKKSRLNLDYYSATSTLPIVDNYITSAKPAIAYSSKFGHYFVVDDKLQNTYTLKDPRWYNTKKLNDPENFANEVRGYNNYFDTANLFSYLKTPKKLTASMYLYLSSPAELLITDPLGRKLGEDPILNLIYNEIPEGSYTQEGPIITSDIPLDPNQIHKTKVIYIPTPIDGNYDIRVIGTGAGTYELNALTYDNQGESHTQIQTGNTQTDLNIDYNLNFTPDAPENISIQPTDAEAPIVSHTQLNSEYILNSSPIAFNFSAQDAGVGVFSVSAKFDGTPIENGAIINFNQLGFHTIQIIAEDFIGNTATKTITYDIIYNFSGFLSPIKTDGTGIYKLGRTLPTKFQLKDANGTFISNSVAQLFVAKISDGITGTDEIPFSTSNADMGNIFRYDAENNQYIYNLATNNLSVGSWQLKVILDDNRFYTVMISINIK
jgi:hypothetical protein